MKTKILLPACILLAFIAFRCTEETGDIHSSDKSDGLYEYSGLGLSDGGGGTGASGEPIPEAVPATPPNNSP